MPTSSQITIVSALQNLRVEEIDRVRLQLWRRFGEQLRNIPDAPDPDELLQEVFEDLLADRRHVPLEKISLMAGLFNIVRSKVEHIYKKWKREGTPKVSDDVFHTIQAPEVQEQGLREEILKLVNDDPLLTQIVEYRLAHSHEEPIRAQKIADALGVDIKAIYNANRRLKARLAKLLKPVQFNQIRPAKEEKEHVTNNR